MLKIGVQHVHTDLSLDKAPLAGLVWELENEIRTIQRWMLKIGVQHVHTDLSLGEAPLAGLVRELEDKVRSLQLLAPLFTPGLNRETTWTHDELAPSRPLFIRQRRVGKWCKL
jgi:hypothetical protein